MSRLSSRKQCFNLWVLLSRTRDAVFKARQKELQQWGLSIVQAAVFSAIDDIAGNVTPAKIARWIFREPQSVTEVLGRMKKRGLLRKSKDLHKKNQVIVSLTEKGHETYHNQLTNTESIYNIMSCLSVEERQQMSSYLRRIQDASLKELRTSPQNTSYSLPYK